MGIPILLVDDSGFSRKMIRKNLPTDLELDIVEASNGVEAMEILRKDDLKLVLLDLTMPEMDGFEVLEALRAEGITVPVYVVSADIQPHARERIDELGAKGFISKPPSAEQLAEIFVQEGLV